MTTATELLQRHLQWLIDDNAQWQSLIADDIVWDLPYAPSLGHPLKLEGRQAVLEHVGWFIGAVKDFRFFDALITAAGDTQHAVARVRAQGLVPATGRTYQQEYVVFLAARDGRIRHLREYFDPVRAALAFDAAIVGVPSRSI
ncbi:nuclear transport factor 2 family protein [Achromobacter sp. UMC71]|uniref:nuclear transport factor 2 family protein n=1 Tax=Achromobacter sp. UMC71 TaxID=1862320 RepID=UPI00160413B5|nr:nuclear transport factor 2 family protein [Achromobacter sp. UMC71]MBB1627221.1 phenazine biosynthesis protein [Achromobacter sp. UMC71]